MLGHAWYRQSEFSVMREVQRWGCWLGLRGVGIAMEVLFQATVSTAEPPHSKRIVQLVDGAQGQTLPTNLGIWKLELWQIVGG